mmetsp:Transcript_10783/g.44196  ORF Transcript_10783/g.44196 Transcript_10783/m.44196 type:complete len:208 (-) Transcript_10783:542-1165(-)
MASSSKRASSSMSLTEKNVRLQISITSYVISCMLTACSIWCLRICSAEGAATAPRVRRSRKLSTLPTLRRGEVSGEPMGDEIGDMGLLEPLRPFFFDIFGDVTGDALGEVMGDFLLLSFLGMAASGTGSTSTDPGMSGTDTAEGAEISNLFFLFFELSFFGMLSGGDAASAAPAASVSDFAEGAEISNLFFFFSFLLFFDVSLFGSA